MNSAFNSALEMVLECRKDNRVITVIHLSKEDTQAIASEIPLFQTDRLPADGIDSFGTFLNYPAKFDCDVTCVVSRDGHYYEQ